MGKKDKMSFKKYDKMMRSVPGSPRNMTPKCCKECMYYQPVGSTEHALIQSVHMDVVHVFSERNRLIM